MVDKAVIHLENGKTFTINANNNAHNNVYIQSGKLNDTNYSKCYLNYKDVVSGGVLDLNMGNEPNKNFGSGDSEVPVSRIE